MNGGIYLISIEERFIDIDVIYGYAEFVLKEFIESESSFEELYALAEWIYKCIVDEGISFRNLSTDEGELHIHLVNVAVLSGRIARYLNMSYDKIITSILGGLLHDIGKYYVPNLVLNKPRKLTKFEEIAMSTHVDIGKEIVSLFTNSEELLSIIEHHHTFIKSLNKPLCLKELHHSDERLLPIICSIADVTDAIVSERPYKKRLPLVVARNELHIKGIMNIDNIYNFI